MEKKRPLGHGVMPFWQREVNVSDLPLTSKLLRDAGFKDSSVSMEKLIPWECLKGLRGIANVRFHFLISL